MNLEMAMTQNVVMPTGNYSPVQNFAVYTEQLLEDYQGNPLNEALPPILSIETAGKMMAHLPSHSQKELILPREIRLHCLKRIKALVYPLPEAISVESTVSQMIRYGYKARNPLFPETMRHRYALSTHKNAGEPTGFIYSTASCLLLTGYSGMGKTTLIKSILNLYPQVIYHRCYQGTKLYIPQIVFIKISIPHDGLLSGLCLEFFRAVDKILGTDYMAQHSGARIDLMLKKMEEIAANYFIGIIVIDELQNLNLAKSGGAQKVLNYFRSLLDNVGIPLVFIGTYASTGLFAAGMQDARRATDEGVVDIWRPVRDDAHWTKFLDMLQQYQWIGDGTAKFDEAIRDEIYELSQGITDFAVKLTYHAQRIALLENKTCITGKLLRRVYDREFRFLQPALTALKSGKPMLMAKFDDLLPPKDRQQMLYDVWNTETPVPKHPQPESGHSEPEPSDVTSPTGSHPKDVDSVVSAPEKSGKTMKKARKEKVSDTDDHIDIAQGTSAYEALKAQGLIANLGWDADAEKPELTMPRKF